jgi:hypothetical protein
VPISACGGKLRVIAYIEEPPLIRKILGPIQRREASGGTWTMDPGAVPTESAWRRAPVAGPCPMTNA